MPIRPVATIHPDGVTRTARGRFTSPIVPGRSAKLLTPSTLSAGFSVDGRPRLVSHSKAMQPWVYMDNVRRQPQTSSSAGPGRGSARRGRAAQPAGHASASRCRCRGAGQTAGHHRSPRRSPNRRPRRRRSLFATDDDHAGAPARGRRPGHPNRRPRRCPGGPDPHHAPREDARSTPFGPTAPPRSNRNWPCSSRRTARCWRRRSQVLRRLLDNAAAAPRRNTL